jgi:hypothetical protein
LILIFPTQFLSLDLPPAFEFSMVCPSDISSS